MILYHKNFEKNISIYSIIMSIIVELQDLKQRTIAVKANYVKDLNLAGKGSAAKLFQDAMTVGDAFAKLFPASSYDSNFVRTAGNTPLILLRWQVITMLKHFGYPETEQEILSMTKQNLITKINSICKERGIPAFAINPVELLNV